jgi:hypothetical protein
VQALGDRFYSKLQHTFQRPPYDFLLCHIFTISIGICMRTWACLVMHVIRSS